MSQLPPANWYPDPEIGGQQRYWDGSQWTEHRAPLAEAATPTAPAPAAAPPPTPAAPTAPSGAPAAAPAPQTSGLAIASLVVGILSFFLGFVFIGGLTGIVAIVLGIVAIRGVNASNGAQGGKGLAVGGIVSGVLAVLVALAIAVFLVAVRTAVDQPGGLFDCLDSPSSSTSPFDC